MDNRLAVTGVKPDHLHNIVEPETPETISGRQDNLVSLPYFDIPLMKGKFLIEQISWKGVPTGSHISTPPVHALEETQ